MKWDKSARALAVASLTLASTVAWGQVVIQNGSGTAGAALNPLGTTTVPSLTAVNGGKGINPIGSTAGVLNALSATGGNGGPSGTPTAAMTTAGFGTGLAGTSHDFASGTGSSKVGTAGLCTFCHTPHKAASTLLLWNHTLSSATFQWDVAATTSGTALPGFTGNAYNGPSAKCLSCHDGSVAIGDVGWFSEGTANGTSALSTFKVGGGAQGTTCTPVAPATTCTNTVGSTSKMVGSGGNLSGNHPVAIPYPLNGSPNVYNGSTTGAQLATNDWELDPTANNIRLYSDIGGGAIVGKTTAGKTGIECSSCHDPHNKAAKDDFFLRGTLVGSTQADGYLCLQCHKK